MKSVRFSDINIKNRKQSKRYNKTNDESSKVKVENTAKVETLCACFGKIHTLHATCIKCGRINVND
ncbi:hypothetical protein FG379_001414 [Cryptosporidium bovis]|uniref:uncharacterized protein n=1 Tax=Cryptosporidium bovis TaxID=310047 RepID=UPI00351A0A45|nr:hypothetical protein FG379_001414 [Cryptosporidium bovis]